MAKDRRITLIYEISEKTKEVKSLLEELKMLNGGKFPDEEQIKEIGREELLR